MNLMPKMTPSEMIAERLVNLRKAAGLTRKDIESRYGIKSPSLRSWEIGSRTLKKKNAEILASAFKEYGIDCSVDWLLEGKGPNPLETAAQSTEYAYVLKEKYRFESFYKNSVIISVDDDYMTPWIRKGDLVGGVFIEPKDAENFINQVCIVKTREFGTQIRLVQKTANKKLYDLISFSKKGEILNAEIEAAAVVIFFRRLEEKLTS